MLRSSVRKAKLPPLRHLTILAMMCCAGGLWWSIPAGADAPRTAAPRTQPAVVSPTAGRKVDFVQDVAPILQAQCVQCHAGGRSKGGLRMDSRQDLLKGGDSKAAAVEPGRGDQSLLIDLVSDTDPDVYMPKKGRHLSAEEVGILRAWVDQGAAWPAGYSLSHFKQAPLEPRRPVVPAAAPGSELTNPIDLVLQPYFSSRGVPAGKVVDDRVYARRVYLDVIGLLPPPAELDAFVADASPDKRPRLVRRLLADNRRYAEHWLSFWNDLLRNDYRGTGYVDGGRKAITPWLFNALETDVPFDQFVRELVTGANGSEGFIKGIVWRGTVNASQTPQMQAAQSISQVFMGINLKCGQLPRQLHQRLEADRFLRPGGRLRGQAAGNAAVRPPAGRRRPAQVPLPATRHDRPLGARARGSSSWPTPSPAPATAGWRGRSPTASGSGASAAA